MTQMLYLFSSWASPAERELLWAKKIEGGLFESINYEVPKSAMKAANVRTENNLITIQKG